MEEVRGLDAIILIVKDLAKQKEFYEKVLGLELEADYGDAVFFKCGKQKIALFAYSHHKEGTKNLEGAKKGISHLEFRVKKSDLDKIQKRLKDAGFHAYRETFQDADGNLFHFNMD